MEIEEELVSDTELAVLVLNYINKQGWLATAAALKRLALSLSSFTTHHLGYKI